MPSLKLEKTGLLIQHNRYLSYIYILFLRTKRTLSSPALIEVIKICQKASHSRLPSKRAPHIRG